MVLNIQRNKEAKKCSPTTKGYGTVDILDIHDKECSISYNDMKNNY